MRSAADVLASCLIVVAGVMCLVLAGAQYIDIRENVETRCLLAPPPSGVDVSENALVSARATVLPAGRLCVWKGATGGYLEQQTGQFLTIVTMTTTALALLASFYLVRQSRWRFACTAGLALCTLGWGAVLLQGR